MPAHTLLTVTIDGISVPSTYAVLSTHAAWIIRCLTHLLVDYKGSMSATRVYEGHTYKISR